MAVVKRGKILRGDLANWDGRSATSTRTDATGGTLTGLSVGNEVDVLQVFGSGTSRTAGSLAGAVRYIGTDTVTLVLAPGTWTIDVNVTLPSNLIVRIPAGCILDVASGKTLTISGYVQAGDYQIFSGTGTVAIGFGEVFPEWWGAVGNGVADDTTPIQAAITTGRSVLLKRGAYCANNLTQSTNFQHIVGTGKCQIFKNANGASLTSTGNDVVFRNIDFRDDNEQYTGNGLVCSGDRIRVIECGGYLIAGVCLKITGSACQVYGTCNIYQSATDAGYDIEIGVSGTATLYHRVYGIYSSNAGGGIKFIDCGSQSVVGSQFGKLFIDAGTSPAGVNGGTYSNNRILGDVTVEISNSDFSANTFGAVTITLLAGTSGHHFGASNTYDASATITDNSTEATIMDTRESSMHSYTPTWTGASVNPAIGNGTLTGRYSKHGKMVHVWIRMLAGSSTTFGTGAWFFSVPFIPATFGTQVGSARILDTGTNFRVGASVTLADGTARVQATADSDTANLDSARPMTWASGDELFIAITYLTN